MVSKIRESNVDLEGGKLTNILYAGSRVQGAVGTGW